MVLGPLYDADRNYLQKKIEPLVWRYEHDFGQTRYNLARLPMGVAGLAMLFSYVVQMEEPSELVILTGFGIWWLLDDALLYAQTRAIAHGPLPNHWRVRSGLRIVLVMLLYLALAFKIQSVSFFDFMMRLVVITCAIKFLYILSANPLPADYTPNSKGRPF